jgi:hypothetical protein
MMASTWRALASVVSSDEPAGVWKVRLVSEKSALGTNSVPSSGTSANAKRVSTVSESSSGSGASGWKVSMVGGRSTFGKLTR